MKPFAKGDKVRISGRAGVVVGEVLEALSVDELPNLDEFIPGVQSEIAKEALRENLVGFVLALFYKNAAGEGFSFVALHISDRWLDLRGEELQIEKVGRV